MITRLETYMKLVYLNLRVWANNWFIRLTRSLIGCARIDLPNLHRYELIQLTIFVIIYNLTYIGQWYILFDRDRGGYLNHDMKTQLETHVELFESIMKELGSNNKLIQLTQLITGYTQIDLSNLY